MPRTTFSISYYCRESKKNKQNLAPLEMCICINQERLFINLPAKFNPKEFNRKRKPTYIEDMCSQYRVKVNEIINQLILEGMPITSSTIREYLKTGGIKVYTVSMLIDKYMEEIKVKVGKSLSVDGYHKYELVAEFLKNEMGDKQVGNITTGDMLRLYELLKSMYLIATAGGKMAKIKSMFQYAFDNGLLKSNPCNQLKINKGNPSVKYLSAEDIEKIKALKLDDMERLDKVRDLMLFQVSTGVAYADLVSFDAKQIEVINNVPTYSSSRQKTKIEFTTVILPLGMKILQKYNGSLPLISNQKYNLYLKEIQKLAKIETVITTHLLRKTYAHHLLNNGVRIETVAKALGHSNTIITQRTYAKTVANTVAKEIGNLLKDTL